MSQRCVWTVSVLRAAHVGQLRTCLALGARICVSNFVWDGKNVLGSQAKDGVYFYKVVPKEYVEEEKDTYSGRFHLMR